MDDRYMPKTPEGRLWHLVEECGEVIQEASKLARFGPNGDPGWEAWCAKHGTPRERLLRELLDVDRIIALIRKDLSDG